MPQNTNDLSGKEKATILLSTLDSDYSAEVFKHLSEEQIEELTLEIANMKNIAPQIKDEVLEEFYQIMETKNYIDRGGGLQYAKEILEKSLGEDKAKEIMQRLTDSIQAKPFDALRQTDPSQLINLIQDEHPQTIALIMAYLHPDQASEVLSSLSQDKQITVTQRIAKMSQTSPDVIQDVEEVMEDKIASFITDEYAMAGGLDSIVDIINQVDRGTEKNILDQLEEKDEDLSEEIRQRLFVFEDIVQLSDQAIQMTLREVDNDDVALALKTVDDEVKEKITSNMSDRAANMLEEDMEYMGAVRLRDVEEAQQRIVSVIRELEESGEIVIARGEESEIVG